MKIYEVDLAHLDGFGQKIGNTNVLVVAPTARQAFLGLTKYVKTLKRRRIDLIRFVGFTYEGQNIHASKYREAQESESFLARSDVTGKRHWIIHVRETVYE